MRMECVISRGIFLRYRKGKTFYERLFVSNLKTKSKMSILPPTGKISADAHAAHWCTKRPVVSTTVPQNSLEFWRSTCKSYSMIGVKANKIVLPLASSWLCKHGFSALTEIKSKKLENSWNWRQSADALRNDGTSFQSHLFPKAGTPFALIFLKQLCFVVSVPRIFLFSQCAANWKSLRITAW